MNDFFSKVENFFFDILGLIMPGAIFLLILLSPVLFVNLNNIPATTTDSSLILSALKTVTDILKQYWTDHPTAVLTIGIVIAYLIGHTIKVFSRIKYEILAAIFDNGINRKPKTRPGKKTWITSFFRNAYNYIFTFRPPHHFSTDEAVRQNCLTQLNTRLGIDFPDDDRSLTKISGVISNQENLRTLGTFFLAKYNFYRSLSLIFLITPIYYLVFFSEAGAYMPIPAKKIALFFLIIQVFMWFTFHVKFKRYWTLYGDERIMSLFYFLNKKKLNEG